MNLKLIASVVLVGGVLIFFGVKPSNLLDQGGNMLGKFSGDFLAIFNGNAKDRQAKEIRGNAGGSVQVIYDATPAAAGDETSAIMRDIDHNRSEAARTAKVVDINAEELKRRLEDQKKQLE